MNCADRKASCYRIQDPSIELCRIKLECHLETIQTRVSIQKMWFPTQSLGTLFRQRESIITKSWLLRVMYPMQINDKEMMVGDANRETGWLSLNWANRLPIVELWVRFHLPSATSRFRQSCSSKFETESVGCCQEEDESHLTWQCRATKSCNQSNLGFLYSSTATKPTDSVRCRDVPFKLRGGKKNKPKKTKLS